MLGVIFGEFSLSMQAVKVGKYIPDMPGREKKQKVQKYSDRTKLDFWLTRHAEESEKKKIRSPHRAKLILVCIKQFLKSADSIINVTICTEKFFLKYLVCFHPNRVKKIQLKIAAISLLLLVR